MKRKTILTLAILLTLLVSLFGMVSADGETDPAITEGETDTTEVVEGQQFWTHPVVKILSAYFDRETEEVTGEEGEETGDEECDATVEGDCDGEETGDGDEGETDSGLGPIGEEIAAYHEAGMGFGVLVKIYSMVEKSAEACKAADAEGEPAQDTTEDECGLTAEELVEAFEGGMGMGQLYKEFNIRPDLKGVGHVKQALCGKGSEKDKACPSDTEDTGDTGDTEVEDQDQDDVVDESLDSTNGKDPKVKTDKVKTLKDRTPKGKGPKK